jgi:20S proteasome subunit beta 6
VLASSGMQADAAVLHKTLQIKLQMYQHQNGKEMSTPAIAQMLSNTLYYKRFFPYYTFNVLAGVDEKGNKIIVIVIYL